VTDDTRRLILATAHEHAARALERIDFYLVDSSPRWRIRPRRGRVPERRRFLKVSVGRGAR
jgi:hypothetical protein